MSDDKGFLRGLEALHAMACGPELPENERDVEISTLEARIRDLQAEASELRQAVGLATTLAPHVVMDPDHPLEMMREVVAHVCKLQSVLDAALALASAVDTLLDHWERMGKTTLGGHEANLAIALNKFRAHDAGKGQPESTSGWQCHHCGAYNDHDEPICFCQEGAGEGGER